MKKKRKLGFKILIGLIVVIVLSLIAVGGWLGSVTGTLNRVHDPEEVQVGNGQKQALILYQPSSNDTTKNVTMELAQRIGAEGYSVTINYPSEKLSYQWQDYDLIAFGTPVYMGKVSSTLEKYVQSLDIKSKAVILYVTGMNQDVASELTTMNDWLDSSNFVDGIKIGKADPEAIDWFVLQCIQNWEEGTASSGYFEIHDLSQSGADLVSGATMK